MIQRSVSSLRQLFTMSMDVHERLGAISSPFFLLPVALLIYILCVGYVFVNTGYTH